MRVTTSCCFSMHGQEWFWKFLPQSSEHHDLASSLRGNQKCTRLRVLWMDAFKVRMTL
jgi:hypothetical protein